MFHKLPRDFRRCIIPTADHQIIHEVNNLSTLYRVHGLNLIYMSTLKHLPCSLWNRLEGGGLLASCSFMLCNCCNCLLYTRWLPTPGCPKDRL